MKGKQVNKRLSLKKITIARLDNREIEEAKGGFINTIALITLTLGLSQCICTELPGGTCECTRPFECTYHT